MQETQAAGARVVRFNFVKRLVAFIPAMASTPALQKQVLVDNPVRLYGPELAA